MHTSLYEIRPLLKRSLFQKIFGQHTIENAIIEVNNLLATKPVNEISQPEISEIEAKYAISLEKEFKLNLEEFYAVYLNHCLSDRELNEKEIADLLHLKQILNLNDKAISTIHTLIGEVIYRSTFEDAVKDGRLSDEEKAFLHKLETTLSLPKQLSDKISAEVRMNYVGNYVSGIISDQRLSPAEENELNAIALSLNVKLSLSTKTQEQLHKLKLYWAIENLQLPEVDTDIHLQKSEICHFKMRNVQWLELRVVRTRAHSTSYRYSLKIAKGFYLRTSGTATNNYTSESLKVIDTGTLYLTNKRLIFTGIRKNTTIRLEKLLDVIPYSNGVELYKETGKSPVLQIPHDADIFSMMLGRLLDERQYS